MRAVGARKKSEFWGTWSILEQVGGRGRYVVEGGGHSERWGFRGFSQEFLGI